MNASPEGKAGLIKMGSMMKHGPRQILVSPGADRLGDSGIKIWKEVSRDAISSRGYFAAALSGGKTPLPLYRRLAEVEEALSWEQTHIFLADERFVPPQDPDSNFHMIRNTLLTRIRIPSANIHPVPLEGETLHSAARKYEREMRLFFKIPQGKFPEFDLILLGIGENGHTASLFPGNSVLDDDRHLAAAVILNEVLHHRITLTLPVINHARNVIFLASGENKAGVLEKIIREKDPALPATLVSPKHGKLWFLLDADAAKRVGEEVHH